MHEAQKGIEFQGDVRNRRINIKITRAKYVVKEDAMFTHIHVGTCGETIE